MVCVDHLLLQKSLLFSFLGFQGLFGPFDTDVEGLRLASFRSLQLASSFDLGAVTFTLQGRIVGGRTRCPYIQNCVFKTGMQVRTKKATSTWVFCHSLVFITENRYLFFDLFAAGQV